MPPDSGMAFVIALHMSADRKSMLPDIIARWTAMPVAEAEHGNLVEANHVYMIPPGHIGALRRGRLRLRHLAANVPREAAPIDEFFDSLAADLGEDAIGIVLSRAAVLNMKSPLIAAAWMIHLAARASLFVLMG